VTCQRLVVLRSSQPSGKSCGGRKEYLVSWSVVLFVVLYFAFDSTSSVACCLFAVLKHPPFKTAGPEKRLCESRDQLLMKQRLDSVGRGSLLASIQTTREQWADALCELDSRNVDDSPAFQVSFLYSLLRLHQAVGMT
jgi:hypothetical protein